MNTGTTYSEQELIALLRRRNEQSFGYLYDNYSGTLPGVISGIIHNPETARDVLQEVFVNIGRKIESCDPEKGRSFTWMMNMARNAEALKNHSIPGNIDPGIAAAADTGLKKILARLKEDHRVLIDMSYFQGYTHEEITRMMDISLGTEKPRIRSALLFLRKMIK